MPTVRLAGAPSPPLQLPAWPDRPVLRTRAPASRRTGAGDGAALSCHPSGFAIVQVPLYDQPATIEDPNVTDEAERVRRFGQRDHVRKYGRDFTARLSEVFEVESVVHPDHFTGADVRRFGFGPTTIRVCSKHRH